MGKVHGSLARAGKVKSATPKVSSLAQRLLFNLFLSFRELNDFCAPFHNIAKKKKKKKKRAVQMQGKGKK